MEALLAFISENCLPKTVRANVSSESVCSLTVGVVDRRAEGYGISAATTLHRGLLTRLLHDVARDATLEGERPELYSSVCLNVNVRCRLHVDARSNDGPSFIVAAGDYTGGALFLEDASGNATCCVEEEALHAGGRTLGR